MREDNIAAATVKIEVPTDAIANVTRIIAVVDILNSPRFPSRLGPKLFKSDRRLLVPVPSLQ